MKKIKDLAFCDRPREKMLRYGPEKLSDVELLAILLRTGTPECDVINFSKKVLAFFHDKKISEATIEDFKAIKGVGTAKACGLMACFELGRRELQNKKVKLILSAKDVWERMEDIRGSKKEHFVVFYLDSRNQEIRREIVSIGTLNENLIHPREVFENAIKNNAASIIVSHNHPSGDTEPSAEDTHVTKKLIRAGRLLDIEIADHVIVSKTDWRSIIAEIVE